jgi:IS1 family transposase
MKSFKPWVRKLTGKPACATPADCEFEARRIHWFYETILLAASSTAVRIHSDLLFGDLEVAARTRLASAWLTLNCIRMDRFSDFGTFGRPSFAFINILSITKIIVDGDHTLGNTFSQEQRTSMANKLQFEKKVMVISMLCEGSSIRAIERITGINRNTIMNLGVRVGQECIRLQNAKMRNIQSEEIQIDEIWGFVGAKRGRARQTGNHGDVWTFIALDRDSKLIPSFWFGQRTMEHARYFLRDLKGRLAKRVQLSSDGLAAYGETVGGVFGGEVDYGQVVKTYSVTNLNKDAASRYSPAEVVKTERTVISGMPDISRISTSHIEKQNHTLRMHCRRLTRLTNAFSKKLENFHAAVALNFAYYNFCKRHITINTTPAVASGVEDHEWTVAELVKTCGE